MAHLQLVRNEIEGGEEASDAVVQKLAVDFAETTASNNFILARYAATSEKFPDFSKRVRDFLCAVIGATGGSPEFVPITDDDLAAQMGVSTKTLQNARAEFRTWPDHTKVCEIKEHWRDRETLESHPHSYRCHITFMSAAATADARLSPRYGDVERRREVFKESARVRADAAKGFVLRPAKTRKKKTDSELLLSDVEQATNKIRTAAGRQTLAKNVDFDRLVELRAQLASALSDFDAAFGFESPVSTQNTDIRSMEAAEAFSPDDLPNDGCVEASSGEVESAQVEKFSTQNGSIESTSYENEAAPDWDVSRFVWMENGKVCWRFPPDNAPPWLNAAIDAEGERLKGVAHV
jgi:hypothetical protein